MHGFVPKSTAAEDPFRSPLAGCTTLPRGREGWSRGEVKEGGVKTGFIRFWGMDTPCNNDSKRSSGLTDCSLFADLNVGRSCGLQVGIEKLATNSYIVPIPKPNDVRTKALTCNDFRGIAISPAISKVFEYCFLDRFQSLLTTEENQFGFKKGISCSHAIYTARGFIDRHIMAGSTVNMCAIDLTKAFDKVNHHALFIKLMKRHIPVQALEILENLFSNCHSSVKWNNMWSSVFEIS